MDARHPQQTPATSQLRPCRASPNVRSTSQHVFRHPQTGRYLPRDIKQLLIQSRAKRLLHTQSSSLLALYTGSQVTECGNLMQILSSAVSSETWQKRLRTSRALDECLRQVGSTLPAIDLYLGTRRCTVKSATMAADITQLKWIVQRRMPNEAPTLLPLLEDLQQGCRRLAPN